MIPRIYITQWKKNSPWISEYQVEQDLLIERAMVEIFSDKELKEQLAFRGGTALHKLFLKPQVRYSEDIDLVQVESGSIGDLLSLVREKLKFLGVANFKASAHNATLIYRINSETEPVVKLKLKVEINTREHFSVFGYNKINYSISNDWYKGNCEINTFTIEELLSTKTRALYQRRKGRDLFDLYFACQNEEVDLQKVIEGFAEYLKRESTTVSKSNFISNMETKMEDPDFLGDITSLLRTGISFDYKTAWKYVRAELIEKLI